jgi:hypothetical protein
VVTADELTLVGMNDNVIDSRFVHVIALQATSPGIPNLHGSVLGAGDHPFAFAVKCDAGDVIRVTFKGNHRVGIGRFDIKKFYIVMTGRRQESLVRCDAQAVDLGVRMLDGTRTNARECFPKAICVKSAQIPALSSLCERC